MLKMPQDSNNQLSKGQTWSTMHSFSFGLMGTHTYERIYTLKDILNQQGKKIAVISMDHKPTAEMAEEMHEQQQGADFSRMFDNTETYKGSLKINLSDGYITKYSEKLDARWAAVDPTASKDDTKEPAALQMGVIKSYELKIMD